MSLVTLTETAVWRNSVDQIQALSPGAGLSNFKVPSRCGVSRVGGRDERSEP
jgi:hypothetical protein